MNNPFVAISSVIITLIAIIALPFLAVLFLMGKPENVS